MKTKFKFLLVTCLIAAVAITGFNFVQNGSNIDVSLADIAVMAKADGESGTSTVPCYDDPNAGTGPYNKRECDGCDWNMVYLVNKGTCTFSW